MSNPAGPITKDWVGNRWTYFWAWGLPTALLVVGIFIPPPFRTVLWSAALVWKGGACLINASRCGRTHCYLTGPFFLVLAILTVLHGSGWLSLGEQGWLWIGVVIALGTAILWVIPERLFGKFLRR